MLLMWDVSKYLRIEMISWMKAVSCSLLGVRVNFNVWMISLEMVILIISGA